MCNDIETDEKTGEKQMDQSKRDTQRRKSRGRQKGKAEAGWLGETRWGPAGGGGECGQLFASDRGFKSLFLG